MQPCQERDDELHTGLLEASMDGHVEVAKVLLDAGAPVNQPSENFESPLTLACKFRIDFIKKM
jgi:ankyrin repeat protein